MKVFKRRTRVVNFRLSEEEYGNLRNMCIASGARSVSDFARSAICQLVSGRDGSSEHFQSTVHELHGRVEELDREVKRLAELLGVTARLTTPNKSGQTASEKAGESEKRPLDREKLCA